MELVLGATICPDAPALPHRTRSSSYDNWVDVPDYLREELSLVRSAVPTSTRWEDYLRLKRNGQQSDLMKQHGG